MKIQINKLYFNLQRYFLTGIVSGSMITGYINEAMGDDIRPWVKRLKNKIKTSPANVDVESQVVRKSI